MIEEFLVRYPEFSDIDKKVIELALGDSKLEVCAKVWGKKYKLGLFALSAHLLCSLGYLDGDDREAGSLPQVATSMTAGSLSVGYTSPIEGFSGDTNGLANSQYGQNYLRLQKLVARHFLVVR